MMKKKKNLLNSLFKSCLKQVVHKMMVEIAVSKLVLLAQSATKDHIRVEDKLQSISKLSIPHVIIQQVFFAQTTAHILWPTSLEHKTRKTITHVLEPIYIPQALSRGTCIQQGDLFYSAGLHRIWCWPQLKEEKLRSGFGKKCR